MKPITKEKLIEWGFVESDKDRFIGDPIYRKKVPSHEKVGHYHFQIQITLKPQYGASNPNCGILSIHSPSEECGAIPPDLYNKKKWSKKDEERANGYTVTLEEMTQPIAWYVHTEERVKELYHALTQLDVDKIYPHIPEKPALPINDKPSGLTFDQWAEKLSKLKKKKNGKNSRKTRK
jgi:hypothetical protein